MPLLRRMQIEGPLPARTQLYGTHIVGTLSGRVVSVACSGAGMRSAALHAQNLCFSTRVPAPPSQLATLANLSRVPVQRLLICGFAGGLNAKMAPGSLVIADRVVYDFPDDDVYKIYQPDSVLLAAAESVRLPGIPLQRGTLITAGRVLTHHEEKRALGEQTGALAVDMETAGAVPVAEEHHIPWLAVRAITDSVEADFPLDFNALADADGNVDRGRVVLSTLARPWKIPALIRLGARSSLAARNLATFLESFLEHIPG